MYEKTIQGMRFHKLNVIEKDTNYPKESDYWICECDCGVIKSFPKVDILSGKVKSCGCRKATVKFTSTRTQKLLGQYFGDYLIKEVHSYTSDNEPIFKCICKCGSTNHLTFTQLRNRRRKSCPKCAEIEKLLNPRINTSLGYKGISYNEETHMYRATFVFNKKRITVGDFKDLHIAVQKRLEKIKEYYSIE